MKPLYADSFKLDLLYDKCGGSPEYRIAFNLMEDINVLRDTVAEIKVDRDELKIEMESLRRYKDNHVELLNHMAEHDAEVIEREIEWLHQICPHLDGPHVGILQYRANQLRQKAKEKNND